MSDTTNNSLPVINKSYKVHYKNQYDQLGHMVAELIHSGLDGFVVFRVDSQVVMIPKDRVFLLLEVKEEAKPAATDQEAATPKQPTDETKKSGTS